MIREAAAARVTRGTIGALSAQAFTQHLAALDASPDALIGDVMQRLEPYLRTPPAAVNLDHALILVFSRAKTPAKVRALMDITRHLQGQYYDTVIVTVVSSEEREDLIRACVQHARFDAPRHRNRLLLNTAHSATAMLLVREFGVDPRAAIGLLQGRRQLEHVLPALATVEGVQPDAQVMRTLLEGNQVSVWQARVAKQLFDLGWTIPPDLLEKIMERASDCETLEILLSACTRTVLRETVSPAVAFSGSVREYARRLRLLLSHGADINMPGGFLSPNTALVRWAQYWRLHDIPGVSDIFAECKARGILEVDSVNSARGFTALDALLVEFQKPTPADETLRRINVRLHDLVGLGARGSTRTAGLIDSIPPPTRDDVRRIIYGLRNDVFWS